MTSDVEHGRGNAELDKKQQELLDLCAHFFGEAPHVEKVSDKSITGPNGVIPIRIYQPAHDSPLPLMVYFHGGGFAYGSIASHDTVARRYASSLSAVVVSVDYRLAPEHPFPAGLQDCYAATVWAHEHARELGGRPETLCVAGDSAGGNLSGVTAMMARDKGTPAVAFQLMVSPCCDDARSASYASYSLGTEGSMPSRQNMIDLYNLYVPNVEDGKQAYVSPVHAEDLSGLPPALIFTAGKDMLMDEAEAYAAKLADAGVDVTLKRFKDNIHIGMCTPVPSARDCKLALELIRAQWEHACTADDTDKSLDPFKVKATEHDASSAKL